MVIVWRSRKNIIRISLCSIVWHNVHSQQHTCVSSSYRSNRLGLSHSDPYAVLRGGSPELYYCDMVEWFWWDSSLISTTNWFPSVLWQCWSCHLVRKIVPEMTYVLSGTLSLYSTTTHPRLSLLSDKHVLYDCAYPDQWRLQVDTRDSDPLGWDCPSFTPIWASPTDIKSTLLLYCEMNINSSCTSKLLHELSLLTSVSFLLFPATVDRKYFVFKA